MPEERENPSDKEGPKTTREHQLDHGAQSDQGAKGQKLDEGGNKPRVWSGGEESNQQRR